MTEINQHPVILMVDDDQDDQYLVQEAWLDLDLKTEIRFASDGEELLETLREGISEKGNSSPLPSLILLDLNMPRKNGRKALEEIKSNPDLCHIPVVILTTSKDPIDIHHCYQLGAAGFVTKPASFDALVNTIQTIDRYWFSTVSLPGSVQNGK